MLDLTYRSNVRSHVRRQTVYLFLLYQYTPFRTHTHQDEVFTRITLCSINNANGSFWFCNQNPSCNFFCSDDESYTYEKAAAVWKSTKQPHPCCEKHGKLAKMHVVKNLLKSNYGRPFFVCSDQSNPCSFCIDSNSFPRRRSTFVLRGNEFESMHRLGFGAMYNT